MLINKSYIFLNILIILLLPLKLFGYDYSTPLDGNLTVELDKTFYPQKLKSYSDHSILDELGITFKNSRIYRQSVNIKEIDSDSRTLNTDVVWIDEKTYVILTGNTDRYPHNILGDKIESTGFHIYRDDKLILDYKLPEKRVFETLRPLVADIIPENSGVEIILTSSDINEGSRVDIFSIQGKHITSSKPIGRGFRWLHILGVMSLGNSNKPYLSLVKTPHIGGVLELLSWNGKELEVKASVNNVSTHKIGSDNLNMALQLSFKSNKQSQIIIPSMDFRTLLVFNYRDNRFKVIRRIKLPSVLNSNLFYDQTDGPSIWFSLTDGQIIQLK